MEENKLSGEYYYNLKGYISASLLKEISSSPFNAKAMLNGEKKETKALDFGSLVDCLLTTPDRFSQDYVIYSGKAPTDKMLLLAKDYIRKYLTLSETTAEPDEELIALSSRAEVGYDSRLKNETFLAKFADEALPYCNFCIAYKDKIIIDNETYEHAASMVDQAKNSPFLKKIFKPESNVKVLFQVPLYAVTSKFSAKCLIDCIIIDFDNQTITPIDFKTYEDNFVSNYWKYKYYYQEAWYSLILNIIRNSFELSFETVPELKEVIKSFTIQQFEFVALDKTLARTPIIYKSYEKLHEDLFEEGVINKGIFDIVRVKSITYLIEELIVRNHIDNWEDDFDMLNKGYKYLWL